MPKYVIERDIPGAGKLSAQELRGISQHGPTRVALRRRRGHANGRRLMQP